MDGNGDLEAGNGKNGISKGRVSENYRKEVI